ncbi:MAG TPA: magnesium/cobalt transporter CorA [Opitutaceae bacterium]|nr:magnesium/cobalt transporter CorA [Opitutaceae bacterium]
MIRSFVYSDGKPVGKDLETEALRLVRADKGLVLWVDLENPTAEETKTILDGVFAFHPLAIEDCEAPNSLPKVEDYEEYLFIVTHAVDFSRTEKFNTTELDLFLGHDFIVTYHASALRSVSTLVERTLKSAGPGPRGPDRIAHALLDLIVDNYVPVVDELRDELEEIEEHVLSRESGQQTMVNELLHVRADFTKLRAIVRPQREVIERLARGDSRLIRPKLLPYFRDLRDNLVRLEEMAASYHERLLMAFEIYLNRAAFEANQGIKFLTALTAVTLPVVCVGSWYGMNFQHMPELRSPYGYMIASTFTLISTLVMVFWLKRKHWF